MTDKADKVQVKIMAYEQIFNNLIKQIKNDKDLKEWGNKENINPTLGILSLMQKTIKHYINLNAKSH
tara:strand:- start:454 stop:654 length:201 start_codon:yes stop_codon:yes gene_type:complete